MSNTNDCNLSWDGVLCETCRRFFDSQVMGREEAIEEARARNGSKWFNRGDDQELHDINTLKRCAGGGCQLCALVLANAGKPPSGRTSGVTVDELTAYGVKFYAHLLDPGLDGCTVYVDAEPADSQSLDDGVAQDWPECIDIKFREVRAGTCPHASAVLIKTCVAYVAYRGPRHAPL